MNSENLFIYNRTHSMERKEKEQKQRKKRIRFVITHDAVVYVPGITPLKVRAYGDTKEERELLRLFGFLRGREGYAEDIMPEFHVLVKILKNKGYDVTIEEQL